MNTFNKGDRVYAWDEIFDETALIGTVLHGDEDVTVIESISTNEECFGVPTEIVYHVGTGPAKTVARFY